jgi:hypothetical protein
MSDLMTEIAILLGTAACPLSPSASHSQRNREGENMPPQVSDLEPALLPSIEP